MEKGRYTEEIVETTSVRMRAKRRSQGRRYPRTMVNDGDTNWGTSHEIQEKFR